MLLRNLILARALPLFLFAGSSVAAECPMNQGKIGMLQNCASPQSTAPIFSFSPPSGCVGAAGGTVSYNLIAGTIGASAFINDHVSMTNWMQTSDVFVITGPASATPIGFTAILNTVRDSRCLARLTVGMTTIETTAPGSGTEALQMDAAFLPGEPFNVGMYAQATGVRFDPAQITGSLGFTAMPPGYTLTSCQAYAAVPVATRAVSWGRVKQIYR